jgi:hypothetical protein
MKQHMRSLLENVIGVNVSKVRGSSHTSSSTAHRWISQAFKTNAKVLDIPEKLHLVKEVQPDDDSALNLELLFG